MYRQWSSDEWVNASGQEPDKTIDRTLVIEKTIERSSRIKRGISPPPSAYAYDALAVFLNVLLLRIHQKGDGRGAQMMTSKEPVFTMAFESVLCCLSLGL